jgi:hypothetical protein
MRWTGIDSMRWRGIDSMRYGIFDDMRWRGIDRMRWRGIDRMRWRGIDRMRWRGIDRMRWRGIDRMRWRGIDCMRWTGIGRLRWIGMNYIDICVGCIIGAVASIAFFRCCSLYRTIYKPRRRRFHPHYAFCRSWRAVRCASLFAPLIYIFFIYAFSFARHAHRSARFPRTSRCVGAFTRFTRFTRWLWSPCGTHEALTRPTRRQRSPPCGTHFFFPMATPSLFG